MLLIMYLFFGFMADIFTLSANTSMHVSNDLNAGLSRLSSVL